ncbi:hypothetical protein HYX08_06755 [Candidatus Woesearchaeota archaeon]|nr:hypothetical protein [Candidatus Woesearchaeota archaeon]
MLESAMAITEYLNRQNLDDASVTSSMLQEKEILGDDPLMISRNFNEIVGNFRVYLALIFILFAAFASFAWSMTHRITNNSSLRKTLKIFFKIFVVSFIYLGLIFAFLFSIINFSFTEIAAEGQKLLMKYIIFLAVSIALLYFMFISLSLIGSTRLGNIVQKTLSIGIRKAHYVFASYLIGMLMLAASAVLLYYFMEKNMLLLLLSLALMVFAFVFQRIFMVNMIRKLELES